MLGSIEGQHPLENTRAHTYTHAHTYAYILTHSRHKDRHAHSRRPQTHRVRSEDGWSECEDGGEGTGEGGSEDEDGNGVRVMIPCSHADQDSRECQGARGFVRVCAEGGYLVDRYRAIARKGDDFILVLFGTHGG